MYIILTYDVKEERVAKVCKYLRQYLNWVQNSVFEGDLTTSELIQVIDGLEKLIDTEEDSIRIYMLPREKDLKKLLIGKRYREPENIL